MEHFRPIIYKKVLLTSQTKPNWIDAISLLDEIQKNVHYLLPWNNEEVVKREEMQ